MVDHWPECPGHGQYDRRVTRISTADGVFVGVIEEPASADALARGCGSSSSPAISPRVTCCRRNGR